MPREPVRPDEQLLLTLNELTEICDLQIDYIAALVEEGIIEPLGETPEQWRFSSSALCRIRVIQRLQRDLEVNLPGAALVVELLEEIRQLRQRVEGLERLVE